MEVMGNSFIPGDPRLVEQLVYELKSQGIFDQLRRECIADVDTKPAYQNLRQRVEGSVTSFLKQQTWRPDMVKNQLREQLRKNIHESGYLEAGVERIVEQVVNPKINTVIMPQVEDIAYGFLGIEKPIRDFTKKDSISDLLPGDLEAVSPDSVHSFKSDEKVKERETSDSLNSRADEDESPPFELLIESKSKNGSLPLEDNSVDSHLSGLSGLQSHESNHCSDAKILQADLSNPDSKASQNEEKTQLSVLTPHEVTNIDSSEDSFILGKSEASESKSNLISVEKSEDIGYSDQKYTNNDASDDTANVNNCNEKIIMKERRKDDEIVAIDKNTDNKSSKSSDEHAFKDKRDDRYSKCSNSRDRSKSVSKDNASSSRDKYKKDNKSSLKKDKYKEYKEKSKKSDKHIKGGSSKSTEKSRDTVDKSKRDKTKEKIEKDRDRSSRDKEKNKPEKPHVKERFEEDEKRSDYHKDRSDKGRTDNERIKENHKDVDKKTKSREKIIKSKETSEKDKVDLEKNNEKGEKEQGKSRVEEKLREKSDNDNKYKKWKSTKENSSSEKNKAKKVKDPKSNKDPKSDRSKSSSSKHKSSSNSKKESSSTSSGANKSKHSSYSVKDKPKTSQNDKLKSEENKNSMDGKQTISKKDEDRKRDPKKQSEDDHYSSKEKKSNRRSTDRDSNDGHSSKNNSTNSFSETSSLRLERNDNEFSSSSGPVDSGNSDEIETTSESVRNERTVTITIPPGIPPLILTKPKFASNFQEARKLMKIRKELAKLERQHQLNSSHADNVDEEFVIPKKQVGSENSFQFEVPSESVSPVAISVQPLKLTKPKFASNFQEARKLMKIRKQLAALERENQLNYLYDESPDEHKHDQVTSNMKTADIENSVLQVEFSSEPVARISSIKPFKLNKPQFATNFQEAQKLMKIRKQLAKLERQNQQNISAMTVLDVSSTTTPDDPDVTHTINSEAVTVDIQSLNLKTPKYASNFLEATKLMKMRKQLSELEYDNKLGFTEVLESTETGLYKADKKYIIAQDEADDIADENYKGMIISGSVENKSEIPDSSIIQPLKSTELSQANWEALEARLAQEMSNVNYNCYDESFEHDDSRSSAILISPNKSRETKGNTTSNVEESLIDPISDDGQNDSMGFKGFDLKDNGSNPADFFKNYFGKCGRATKKIELIGFMDFDKATTKTNEYSMEVTKCNNNFKELSIILDVNGTRNINENVDQRTESELSVVECHYLEQQSSSIKIHMQHVHKYIDRLEKEIDAYKTKLHGNVYYGRGQKRKLEEHVDLKNNNDSFYEQITVKKRGRPPGSNSATAKAVKMCNNTSDILPNNSFPLPLSPAESDKSNDKKEEEIVVPAKRKRIAIRASQRYSSEDLYKPRLVICRRSRGAKNTS